MKNINIILVSDPEIKKLNRQWFKKSNPTDVIAFNLYDNPFGEIYISVDTAKRQACERGVDLESELLRLAIHGLAHVDGYDDTTLADFCKMRQKEWEILIKCLSA